MTVNPEQGLRCAGCWLLVMGILGGIVSPLGPLWAFIVGCVLSCCAGGDAKLRKQIPCARCVSITGIVFCSISLVGAVAGGIWVMGAKSDLCNEWLHWVDYYCVSGSRSSPVDSSACTDDDVCLQSRPAFTSFDTCASNGGGVGDNCAGNWMQAKVRKEDMFDCCCASCGWYSGGYSQVMCDRARSDLDAQCGLVESAGLALTLVPSTYSIICIIAFRYVLIRSGQVLKKPDPVAV